MEDGRQHDALTAKIFLSLVHSEPQNDQEMRAYTHFGQFLNKYENLTGTDCLLPFLYSLYMHIVFCLFYYITLSKQPATTHYVHGNL